MFSEPLSIWLEEKMISTPEEEIHYPVTTKNNENTQNFINEFEFMFNSVEFNNGTLTPPQTPPYEQPVFTTLEPITTGHIYTKQESLPFGQNYSKQEILSDSKKIPTINSFNVQNFEIPQDDLAHELAVVEELIKSRAENMVHTNPPSPCGSSNSSCSSFGDYSSDDPEWNPDVSNRLFCHESSLKSNLRQKKPYNRNPEDRKSRKKEQNKNAATRYRLKKKAEIEEVVSKESVLRQQNSDLKDKITEIQRETKYLKKLMYDLFKAKGLLL